MEAIQLIVGLGNPGPQYDQTRHNAGFWFVERVAQAHGIHLKPESKYHGEVGQGLVGGNKIWLLKPDTFMNRSGQAVAALANFYKIPADAILVAHDELDFEPGKTRFKEAGGHGGHNGLRDIIARLGKKEFRRLRVGIGHPGHSSQVTSWVLGKPPQSERRLIDESLDLPLETVAMLAAGDVQKAFQRVNSQNAPAR